MFLKTDLFARWFPYWMWECFINGMWEDRKKQMTKIKEAKDVLSDKGRCETAMRMVINAWPISAQQHLSKHWLNRNPWLGQAACNYAVKATEEETRIAWNFYMSKEEQDSANTIADMIISEWEKEYA